MGLAHARRSEQEHIALLLDEAQGRELAHHRTVEGGLEVEVKVGERLVDGIARKAQSSAQTPCSGGLHLDVEERSRICVALSLLALRPVQLGAEMLGGGGQFEIAEVLTQALIHGGLERAAHCATS